MPDNKDPYEVLGLSFGATDAEITKAFRQLARTLHPDKLVAQNLSATALARAAARFQELQTARTFLLDPEHAADKRAYQNQRASAQWRQQADAARDQHMSARRKRMRTELQRQEQEEALQQQQQQQPQQWSQESTGTATETKATAKRTVDLERQGRELREEYATKAALRHQEEQAADRERRQIRFKWSRKKLQQQALSSSPSEDFIAKQLAQFGTVESVQLLGSKGNAALVTFRNEISADRCVQGYATSEMGRASHTNKAKQQQHQQQQQQTKAASASNWSTTGAHASRDHEKVEDWTVRQMAEREQLMRDILMESEVGSADSTQGASRRTVEEPLERNPPKHPFPPAFPSTADFVALSTPFEKLQHAEQMILGAMLGAK